MTTETNQNDYQLYPQKYILPYDGMSINAGVWAEAHQYHNRMLNTHQVFLHGSGIVTGLEVVASDPPDHIVFVLPGVAIDNTGQMIVLSHPVAYDLGENISGNLRLYLLHREVKAQVEQQAESRQPAYMQNEYVIVARSEPLDAPNVEIARISRDHVKAPITDALDRFAPQKNAIDLRFRRTLSTPPTQQVSAGVCYLGKPPHKAYDRALVHLAQPLSAVSPYQLVVENDVPLTQELFERGLIYLVVGEGGKLNAEQTELVRNYLQEGGKLLVEFCEARDEAAVRAFFQPVGAALTPAAPPHPVFEAPHLFLTLPQGSAPAEKSALWTSESGVLCSTSGYGAIWSGRVQPPVSREHVREAIEWGVNLLTFLLAE